MEKILIIEDSEDVNKLLAEALGDAGYEVHSVDNGHDGLKQIKSNTYSMVLLDLMLPFKSGEDVLKEMRQFSNTPVIVISAKDRVGTKIDLLKLGADDYITKPFDLGEVAARVESNLRRTRTQQLERGIHNYKDMQLDESTKRVTIGGADIELTAKEYGILELLIKNRGKVFTKANLFDSIWVDDEAGDDNTVKTHMSNLRNKLKKTNPSEEYIETVWGLGYRLYKA